MKINQVLACTLTCAIMTSALPCSDTSAAEADWHTLYKNALYEFMDSDKYSEDSAFELRDLSEDGIPELIISEGTEHDDQCHIYSYSEYNYEFMDLGKLGTCGTIGYSSNQNIILSQDIFEDHEEKTYYKLNNIRNFTEIMSYSTDNKSYSSSYKSKIYNDKDFEWVGRANSFTKEEISNAVMGNWQEIYADRLRSIRESDNYTTDYRFELYDIDDDNVPELFVSADGYCSIYTITKGNLNCVGKLHSYYITYDKEKKTISSSYYYSGIHGFKEICTLENGFLKRINTFESISDNQNHAYAVDGESVSYDEYIEKSAPYDYTDSCINLGTKYPLGESVIDYAMNPPALNLTDEQKNTYADILYKASLCTKYKTGFSLFDINDDGVQELLYDNYIYYPDGELISDSDTLIFKNLGFNIGEKILYVSYYNSESNASYDRFYKSENGTLSEFFSCSAEYDYELHEYNKYTLNGKKVSEEEYSSEIEAYTNSDSFIWLRNQHSLNADEITDVLFGSSLFAHAKKIISLSKSISVSEVTQ